MHILYKEIGLLHRDISYGNIAFYKSGDEYVVVILDFDLAMFIDRETGATSNHRTGTAPFMARELLYAMDPDVNFTHDITHDLESTINLSVWRWSGYTPNDFPDEDPLKEWRKGPHDKMLEAKQGFFNDAGRAGKILGRIKHREAREDIGDIRTAYQQKIHAVHQAPIKDKSVIKNLAREGAQKALEAFLQENPGLTPSSQKAVRFYKSKLLQIGDSFGKEQVKESELVPAIYVGISYKQIMGAIDRAIEPRQRGCRCC